MDNVQRDKYVFRSDRVSPSKNDVFVLRVIDVINLLSVAHEVHKNVMHADFTWENYEHVEYLARYCMGVLEEMKDD